MNLHAYNVSHSLFIKFNFKSMFMSKLDLQGLSLCNHQPYSRYVGFCIHYLIIVTIGAANGGYDHSHRSGRVTNTVGSWFDIRNIVIALNTVNYNKCVILVNRMIHSVFPADKTFFKHVSGDLLWSRKSAKKHYKLKEVAQYKIKKHVL